MAVGYRPAAGFSESAVTAASPGLRNAVGQGFL